MSETHIVLNTNRAILCIDNQLKELDDTEERLIENYVSSKIKPERKFLIFKKSAYTREMAVASLDDIVDEGIFGKHIRRTIILRTVNYERYLLGKLKKMCHDACDGKITVSKEDYDLIMGN